MQCGFQAMPSSSTSSILSAYRSKYLQTAAIARILKDEVIGKMCGPLEPGQVPIGPDDAWAGVHRQQSLRS